MGGEEASSFSLPMNPKHQLLIIPFCRYASICKTKEPGNEKSNFVHMIKQNQSLAMGRRLSSSKNHTHQMISTGRASCFKACHCFLSFQNLQLIIYGDLRMLGGEIFIGLVLPLDQQNFNFFSLPSRLVSNILQKEYIIVKMSLLKDF